MSPQYLVRPDVAQAILSDAIRSRTPAVLTYQTPAGWAMLKSRLVGVQNDGQRLLLDLPRVTEPAEPQPETGQNLGVSFRRGSRKCVFSAMVVDETVATIDGCRTAVLRVTWPDDLAELQRRLYQRTLVPQGRLIPVDLWLARAGDDRQPEAMPHRGKMLDLSAGGLSVELPREVRPRWREDDQLSCRFAAGPDRSPVEVTARVTHYSREGDGHVRLGLQFLGLDACEWGRQMLQQIQHITNRLQRSRRQPE